MNRELTVLLKLAAPTGENAKVAAEVSRTVSDLQKSTSGVATAAELASNAMSRFATNGRTAARNGQELASANRELAATCDKLDAGLSELERDLKKFIDQEKEAEQAARAHEAARRRQTAANQSFLEGVSQVTSGVTSLARSMVLLGVADEESAVAMLKKLAAFEAGAQAIRGMISVVQGSVKAWEAYRTAVLAASAADLVKAGTGSAAAGGGFLAGGATATATAGVFAGIGAIGGYQTIASLSGNRAAAERSSNFLRWFSRTTADVLGVEDQRTIAGRSFMPFAEANESEEVVNRMLAARARRSGDTARERWDLNQLRTGFGNDSLAAQMTAARLGLSGNAAGDRASAEFLKSNASQRLAAIQIDDRESLSKQSEKRAQIVSLVQQQMDAEQRLHQAKIGASQEEIANAQKRLQIAQQEASRLSATRQGLLGMDAGERGQLVQALDAVKGGQTLTTRQRKALQQANLTGQEYQDAIQRSEEAEIAKYGDRFKSLYAEQQARNPNAVNVKAQAELVIKLEQDLEKQKPLWVAELTTLIDKLNQKMLADADAQNQAAFREAEERIRRNINAQTK